MAPERDETPGFRREHFDYARLIAHYDRLFGADNVHVFRYEDFRADPRGFAAAYAARFGLDVALDRLDWGTRNPSPTGFCSGPFAPPICSPGAPSRTRTACSICPVGTVSAASCSAAPMVRAASPPAAHARHFGRGRDRPFQRLLSAWRGGHCRPTGTTGMPRYKITRRNGRNGAVLCSIMQNSHILLADDDAALLTSLSDYFTAMASRSTPPPISPTCAAFRKKVIMTC
ncbi:hypothetical protein ACFSUK_34730 [Sphingobium scionense]